MYARATLQRVGDIPYKCSCVWRWIATARLAQSAERKALNLVVVGSSPTVGDFTLIAVAARPPVAQQAGMAKSPQRRKQTFPGVGAPGVSPSHFTLRFMLQPTTGVSFWVTFNSCMACTIHGTTIRRIDSVLFAARQQLRDSIVVSISACHAEDPGSIPDRGICCA